MAQLDDRVDGGELAPLDEPGSDERLSDEARALIERDVDELPETTDAVDEPDGVDG
jgi:hypothetical protein